MLTCNRCEEDKPEDLFAKGKDICRTCYNAYMSEWRKRDPEKLKAMNAKRNERLKNKRQSDAVFKDALYTRQAKWRDKNKTKVKEQARVRQRKYRADPVLHAREMERKRGYSVKDKDKNLAYAKQRQEERQSLIWRIKDIPCKDCDQKFPPYCMDFDHVNGEKTANISEMKSYSMDRILDEIAKCDLVCSNCHRIRTYNRNNKSKGS